MRFHILLLLRKKTSLLCRTHTRSVRITVVLFFIVWLVTKHILLAYHKPSDNVIIIYTDGSYRANDLHKEPQTFQQMLKLFRWYNAGDLVWQYASSTLIDPAGMHMCRTDTFECLDPARRGRVNTILYRPVANLLVEEGTFQSRREQMHNITKKVLDQDVPVLFIGIGTQGEFSRNESARDLDPSGSIQLSEDDYRMSIEGRSMLAKLQKLSTPLLTRGDFSTRIANRYGMSRAISCGCPSLMINENPFLGRRLLDRYTLLRSRVNDNSLRVAINIKPKLNNLLDLYLAVAKRYPNSMFFAQESNDVRALRDKGVPFHRIHAAMSYERWREKLCSMDISLGSRIHGNMAALGCRDPVPVLIIAPDHRVLELSQAMRLPYTTIYDESLRHSDWLSRIVSHLTFDAELFDRNRCEKARLYLVVFEAYKMRPSHKLKRIAHSCGFS